MRGKRKSKEKKEEIPLGKYIISTIPLIIILTLLIFMILQYLGEIIGFLPVIYLSESLFFTSGENVIIFIVTLGLSLFLGLMIAFVLRIKSS